MQGVIPMLAYEDGPAAMDWLADAFGFHQMRRMIGDDGRLAHGEMETGNGLVMLATPTPDYESPKRHRESCGAAKRWSAVPWVIDGVLVYVDDVDKHFAQAKISGANILSEPEDGPPAKRYRVEDIEGHRWMFMEKAEEEQE
jgi:PhnB protein